MPVTIRRIVDNVGGLESWVVMDDENDEGHRVRMDEKVLRNWLKQHETEQHDFEHSHFTLLEFQHISQQIANNRRASTISVFVGMTSTLDEQNVSPPEPCSWLWFAAWPWLWKWEVWSFASYSEEQQALLKASQLSWPLSLSWVRVCEFMAFTWCLVEQQESTLVPWPCWGSAPWSWSWEWVRAWWWSSYSCWCCCGLTSSSVVTVGTEQEDLDEQQLVFTGTAGCSMVPGRNLDNAWRADVGEDDDDTDDCSKGADGEIPTADVFVWSAWEWLWLILSSRWSWSWLWWERLKVSTAGSDGVDMIQQVLSTSREDSWLYRSQRFEEWMWSSVDGLNFKHRIILHVYGIPFSRSPVWLCW